MFERLKQRRAAREQHAIDAAAARGRAQAEQHRKEAEERVDFLESLVDAAKNYQGIGADDTGVTVPIVLKSGERMYCSVEGAALGELRSGGGHWEGANQGVSVHVPGTKSMRYRVGQTKGAYVKNPDTLTAIDTGVFTVTNQRAVFVGAKQTREWAWAKLVSVSHDPNAAVTSIAVSNRQHTSSVAYDDDTLEMVRFWIDLATARFAHTDGALVHRYEALLTEAKSAAAIAAPATEPPPVSS